MELACEIRVSVCAEHRWVFPFSPRVDGVIRSSRSHLSVKQSGRTPRQPAGTERTAVCLKESEECDCVCVCESVSNPDPSVTSSRVKAAGRRLDHGTRPISGGARTDQGQQMKNPEKREKKSRRTRAGDCLEQQIGRGCRRPR